VNRGLVNVLKQDVAVVAYAVLSLKPVKDNHPVKLHKRNTWWLLGYEDKLWGLEGPGLAAPRRQ
jgi:hypothetical protein